MGFKDKLLVISSQLTALSFMIFYFVISFPILSLLDKLLYSVKAEKPNANKLPKNTAPFLHDYLHLKKKDGKPLMIHYVTLDTCDPSKPLMLFVHGFPENWYSWRDQMKRFANDYYVVAIDMRGYNLSEKPSNRADYAMPHLVEDIRQVIHELHIKKGDQAEKPSCVLVVHDWGGAIGWDFVQKHPEYVSKFIVMNIPHPKIMLKNLQHNAAQLRKSWYIYFFQLPFLPERYITRNKGEVLHRIFTTQIHNKERVSDADAAEFQNAALLPGAATAMINYYRNVFTISAFLQKSASPRKKIDVKTLIIWGEKDLALGKELTYGTERFVEDLTVKYIPNASHWVQQDEPELVNQYMSEFLEC